MVQGSEKIRMRPPTFRTYVYRKKIGGRDGQLSVWW